MNYEVRESLTKALHRAVELTAEPVARSVGDFSSWRKTGSGSWEGVNVCHPGNGGLHFLLKSHKLGYLGDRGYIPSQRLFPKNESKFEILSPTVSPGDIILMDICTLHGSLDSETGEPRTYVNTYYQPATDGSYEHLLCGEWQTNIFWSDCDIPSIFVTQAQIDQEALKNKE